MNAVVDKKIDHARQIRSMSREYFIEAVKALPREERETVERDLVQLRIRLAQINEGAK